MAALKSLSPARPKSDRTAFGPVLETFVLAELLELASWNAERLEFFHFRDFSGLRKLAETCGKRFIIGLVL